MKLEFDYRIDGKIHHFEFNFTGGSNYQFKIDDEVMIQKLGD